MAEYEYRVVEVREGLVGGKMSGDKLERLLNDQARGGWQLRAITSVEVKGRIGPGGVDGLQVTVLPFIGHGTPDLVHVRARVVLSSKAARDAATTVVVSGDPTDAADSAGRVDDGGSPGPGPGDVADPDGGPGAADQPGDGSGSGQSAGEVVGDAPVAGPGGARQAVRRSAAARLGTWRTLRESLTPFFTVELPWLRVTVRTPAGSTVVRCDRQGYVDVAVEGAGLTP